MYRSTSSRRRWLVLAVGAALAATATIALSPSAQAAPVNVVGGDLIWGFRTEFRQYITGPISNGTVTANSPATQAAGNGVFTFPITSGTFDSASPVTAAIDSNGSARFLGYHCVALNNCTTTPPTADLDILLDDVRVNTSGTTGTIVVDMTSLPLGGSTPTFYDDLELATLDLSSSTPVANSTSTTYSGLPAVLTAAGSAALGGFLATGATLDPVTFTANLEQPVTPPEPPATGSLTWKVHDAANAQNSLKQARSVADGTAVDATTGVFTFLPTTASVNPQTGEVNANFGGSFVLGNNTQGGYKVRFAAPTFALGSNGDGFLSADVAICPPASPPNGCTTFGTPARVKLVEFSKSSGTVVDTGTQYKITVTPPWNTTNGQFHQELLSHFATVPSASSLANWFKISGSASTDPQKAPAPITVTLNHAALTSQGAIQLNTSIGDGPLTVSVASSSLNLGQMVLNSNASAFGATGTLPNVTVTDQRSANPGWNLTAQVTDFTRTGGGTLPANSLGWTPSLVSKSASQDATAGAARAPGVAGGLNGAELGRANAGAGRGTAIYNAGLTLTAPSDTPAGSYTASLTLTAI